MNAPIWALIYCRLMLIAGQYKFTVNEEDQIIYGIGAIKGVGEGPIEAIIAARESDGEFTRFI